MRFFYILNLFFFSQIIFAEQENHFFSESTQKSNFVQQMAQLHVQPYFEKAIDENSRFILAGAVGSVYLVQLSDDQTRSQWKNHQKISKQDSHAGDILGSGLGSLVVLGSQYFFDENTDHWISHLRGMVWSTLFSSALKVGFGRGRPGESDSHLSFPSGHTSISFLTATSLTYAYGWKVAVIAYPLATFVGLTRLSDDAHWGSDVIAGAFLGYWAGRASFYSTSELESKLQNSEFLPYLRNESPGITWLYRF